MIFWLIYIRVTSRIASAFYLELQPSMNQNLAFARFLLDSASHRLRFVLTDVLSGMLDAETLVLGVV